MPVTSSRLGVPMFDSTKLPKAPPQSELYYWADYVEMLCMIDTDGEYSADRLASYLGFAGDFLATSPDAQDADFADVVDLLAEGTAPPVELYEIIDRGIEPVGYADDLDPDFAADGELSPFGRDAEVADDRGVWCESIFSLLRSRESLLGDNYPFAVNVREMSIKRRDLGDANSLYIFLLCCSLLRYVPRATLQELTTHFEFVSLEALKALLPSAEVELFGTGRTQLGYSRFTGTALERVAGLAAELRGVLMAKEGDFNPRDQGDNGLDLVAWIPMNDSTEGVPAFFAQCACGAKWDGKQYQASYERWGRWIHLSSPPVKMTFIPHLFRRVGGDWYVGRDVSGVLMDRYRIITTLSAATVPAAATVLARMAWNFRRELV